MIGTLHAGMLVAVLVSPLAAAAGGGRGWGAGADVDVSALHDPYARVQLPISVDPTAEGDFHDLRVIDDRGSEVPYVLDPQAPEPPDHSLAMSERGFVPGRGTQAVFDLGDDGMLHDALALRIGRETYFSRVAVDASDDLRTWRTLRDDALVYRVAQDDRGDDIVTFAPTRARWIRLRVLDGRAVFPLDGARLARAASAPPSLAVAARATGGERPSDEPNTQRYTIDLRVPDAAIAAVRIDAATPTFARDVDLARSDDGTTWYPVATGSIARFAHGTPQLDVTAGGVRARFWRIDIRNRDDAPLSGVQVMLLACPHELIFRVRAGRRYAIVFANPTLDGPAYDLGARLAHTDWRAGRAPLGSIVFLRPTAATGPRIPGWLASAAFGAAILVLALFAVRLIRTPVSDGEGAG